jgi:hypothetical protein
MAQSKNYIYSENVEVETLTKLYYASAQSDLKAVKELISVINKNGFNINRIIDIKDPDGKVVENGPAFFGLAYVSPVKYRVLKPKTNPTDKDEYEINRELLKKELKSVIKDKKKIAKIYNDTKGFDPNAVVLGGDHGGTNFNSLLQRQKNTYKLLLSEKAHDKMLAISAKNLKVDIEKIKGIVDAMLVDKERARAAENKETKKVNETSTKKIAIHDAADDHPVRGRSATAQIEKKDKPVIEREKKDKPVVKRQKREIKRRDAAEITNHPMRGRSSTADFAIKPIKPIKPIETHPKEPARYKNSVVSEALNRKQGNASHSDKVLERKLSLSEGESRGK